jgi:hypothetical protein
MSDDGRDYLLEGSKSYYLPSPSQIDHDRLHKLESTETQNQESKRMHHGENILLLFQLDLFQRRIKIICGELE